MSFDQAHKVPLMIVLNKCDLLDTNQPSDARVNSEENAQGDNSRLKPSTSGIRLEQNGQAINDDGGLFFFIFTHLFKTIYSIILINKNSLLICFFFNGNYI